MNRAIHGIVFGSLVVLTACETNDPTEVADGAKGTALAVGAQVFPSSPAVTEYATWGKQKYTAPRRSYENDITLEYAGKKVLQAGVDIDVGFTSGTNQKKRERVTLSDGKPSIRPDLPPGAVDLLELLPPANAQLQLGQAYETPPPDDAYIRSMSAQNKLVLWQQTQQTPINVVQVADVTFVRVEGRGINRLHFVDEDGLIKSSDMGVPFVSVTDLVMIPGEGWQVLRHTRLQEVAGGDENPYMALADARLGAHSSFTVCASRMDLVGSELPLLHATLVSDVPEFAACLNTK